jgi:hypothetical protein
MTDPTTPPIDQGEVIELLTAVLAELRKLSHPAFEAKLLQEIRGQLSRQQEWSSDLKDLLRELDHRTEWLKKHIGVLNGHLERLGIVSAPEG